MAVTIVTVVPEPSTPENSLSVKIRDRHDFDSLCDKVRWQVNDSLRRFPPGKPMHFVFFDDKCGSLIVSDNRQLARALSLTPAQLHNGRLVLYLYENPPANTIRNPDPVDDPKHDTSHSRIRETLPQLEYIDEHALRSQGSDRVQERDNDIAEDDLPIAEKPDAISHHAWNVVAQIAGGGQISSYSQLATALSSIAGLSQDTEYPALRYCLQTMSPSQQQTFFRRLLPLIARLALAAPVFNRDSAPSGNAAVTLSRLQAASIVANIFLCTLTTSTAPRLQRLSMSGLFRSEPFPAVIKVDAVLHYLSCWPAQRWRPGVVHLTRFNRDPTASWTMTRLLQSEQTAAIAVDLGDLRSNTAAVHLEQIQIGDLAVAALGPATSSGVLRLFESPELLASVATLSDPLRIYDVVVITGARRFHDDVETTVVLFKSTAPNASRFHVSTLMSEILQATAAMSAADSATIAANSSEMQSPHRIDLDRDFIVKIVAATLSDRQLVFHTEGDGRMATYPTIAKMMTGVRAGDLIRFVRPIRVET